MKRLQRVQVIQTPTGPMSLARPVVERLLAEGIITGELDGELKARDAAVVKAAVVGHAGICDFCSAPGPFETFDVPDFSLGDGWESTGGWAACETCADLVRRNRRKELVERSRGTMAFPRFTDDSIKELHDRFWQGLDARVEIQSTLDSVQRVIKGTVPPETEADGKRLANVPEHLRREAVKKMIGLTEQELNAAMRGEMTTAMSRKLMEWRRAGNLPLLKHVGQPHPPLPEGHVPHWQRALDAKFSALAGLQSEIKRVDVGEFKRQDFNNIEVMREIVRRKQATRELDRMGFTDDVKYLRDAQAYSFNVETIAAIREAAQGIPTDTPLSAISTPNTGAGWFYFAEPLHITSSSLVSEKTHALLWAWEGIETWRVRLPAEIVNRAAFEGEPDLAELAVEHQRAGQRGVLYTAATLTHLKAMLAKMRYGEEFLDEWGERVEADPAVIFSSYVIDEEGHYLKRGAISPSTRFYWRFGDTFDEMLARNGEAWDRDYGDNPDREKYVMAREATLRAVGELAKFFVMACVWFKQTVPVLTKEPGHIERHARKRMQKEHKLAEAPLVRVVALRKSARVAASEAPPDRQASAREYQSRWIVKGHPRLQACGPGRKDRKLIWVEAYIKGPDDKPLRTRETVYAVIR